MNDEDAVLTYLETHANTYAEWRALLQFGKSTVAGFGSGFIMEVIVREAERDRCGTPATHTIADRVRAILLDLGWELTLAG